MNSLLIAQPKINHPDAQFILNNYNKAEYKIEMRDGVKLFTTVYSPKDTSIKYPILLNRTPYRVWPYGEQEYKENLGPSIYFAYDKYIFVYQDVRGKFMSEGTYENMRPYIPDKTDSTQTDESSDAFDTIDWLIKNIKNNNGKVGIWGISYPGFYAAMALIDAHPALKVVSPQAPIADWFWDDFHHNGALFLAHMFDFMYVFGKERKELTTKWDDRFVHTSDNGFQFYLNEIGPLSNINEKFYFNKVPFWDSIIEHPDYDYFWQQRNILPYLKNIKPAVLVVGGLYDAEDLYGEINIYKTIEKNTPDNHNYFVFGPWIHGGWARTDGNSLGKIAFGNSPSPSEYYLNNIELPFFKYYLKGYKKVNISEASVFDTGLKKWELFSSWPPQNVQFKTLYLNNNKALQFDKPTAKVDKILYDEFISDPANPVPGSRYESNRMPKEYMIEDQRFVSDRTDVLSYETSIINNNITIIGDIEVELYVSTTAGDADWIVKLIDVYPDKESEEEVFSDTSLYGFEQMIRSEIFRGRYRNSFEKPMPFDANKITRISFKLLDVLHTFKPGHRIMVQVQSTWFPLADRNPQKYVDNIYKAKDEDFTKAIHRVYLSSPYQSNIKVRILEKD
ncbi:MAG: CocE/NonD family hydrolase [Chlorobi bacterium]|nr:CocE/NonD family hydrolase [Chlorobiota bacterium]